MEFNIDSFDRNYELADDEYIQIYVFAAKAEDENASAHQIETLFDENKLALKEH